MTSTVAARIEPRSIAPSSALLPTAIDAGALLAQGIQQGMSVDALERLLAMRRELQAEQARSDFFTALAGFQSQIPSIPKSQTARVQSAKGSFSYHYADLAGIQRAIAPQMAAYGLSVTFDTVQDDGGYSIQAKVHHCAGHTETTTFRVPVDTTARMNSAQAAGSALTYGRRYALCAALGIVTAEDDDDGQSVNHAGHPQARPAASVSPYTAGTTQHPPTQDPGPHPASEAEGTEGALPQTKLMKCRLEARISELGLQDYRDRLKAWTAKRWGVGSLADLTAAQNRDLFGRLDDFAERIALEQEGAADSDAATACG